MPPPQAVAGPKVMSRRWTERREQPSAGLGRTPAQHVTMAPSSGNCRHRRACRAPVGRRLSKRQRLGTLKGGRIRGPGIIELIAQKKWGRKPFVCVTFMSFSCTSTSRRGKKKKKSSKLRQLAKATVIPGTAKTPESESAPYCGRRPVTRQAQTICRRCSTAGAANFALQPSKLERGEARLAGRRGIGCTMLPSSGHVRECSTSRSSPRWPLHFYAVGACPAQQ